MSSTRLYCALRAQALHCLRRENLGHSLSPTLLVNEAYIVLSRVATPRRERSRPLRPHCFPDHEKSADRPGARAQGDHPRGRQRHVDWEDTVVRTESDADRILAVAAAAGRTRERSPELARMVELRFFCGFTEDETAQIEGSSPRTVRRQWAVARTRSDGVARWRLLISRRMTMPASVKSTAFWKPRWIWRKGSAGRSSRACHSRPDLEKSVLRLLELSEKIDGFMDDPTGCFSGDQTGRPTAGPLPDPQCARRGRNGFGFSGGRPGTRRGRYQDPPARSAEQSGRS